MHLANTRGMTDIVAQGFNLGRLKKLKKIKSISDLKVIIWSYFRGGWLGVALGFGGLNLTEPPRNPLVTPYQYKTEVHGFQEMSLDVLT